VGQYVLVKEDRHTIKSDKIVLSLSNPGERGIFKNPGTWYLGEKM
jgi:hypothetical protein